MTPIMDKIKADFYGSDGMKSEWVLTETELKDLWNEYMWESEFVVARLKIPYDEFLQKIKDQTITFFGKPIIVK